MKIYQASVYLRNGRAHAVAEFEIKATQWPVAAYRAVKEALLHGRAEGVKRPKLMEIKLSALPAKEGRP